MISLKTPSLLVDLKKVRQHIILMKQKADATGALFRPHFKTHQQERVARIFREEGIKAITVSSVTMAQTFAAQGWDDITIAFPVNLNELDEINHLASSIQLNLLTDSLRTAEVLTTAITHRVGVFIEVDIGYNRTGLDYKSPEIDAIVQQLAGCPQTVFKGFLTHAGQTYQVKGRDEIMHIMNIGITTLYFLKDRYSDRFPDLMISWGDTPSCTLASSFEGFDEVRPGNFVYYDVMQYQLGVCTLEDIAVAVSCPVVACYPEQKRIAIYGGAVHLSKEFIAADNNFKLFGYVVPMKPDGQWGLPINGAWVYSLSQEHGLINMPEEQIRNIVPGDRIGILPVHSCLTANLLLDHTYYI